MTTRKKTHTNRNKRKRKLSEAAKKKATFTRLRKKLERGLTLLGYQPTKLSDAALDIPQKKLKIPPRATLGSIMQYRYEYHSRNNYGVIILLGAAGNAFLKRGSIWIHVVNEKKERVMSFQLKRDLAAFIKVLAFAKFAKQVTDKRPTSGIEHTPMNLVETVLETGHSTWHWQHDDAKQQFRFSAFFEGLQKSEEKIILRKVLQRAQYFTFYRTAKRFARNIRTTWKDTKI